MARINSSHEVKRPQRGADLRFLTTTGDYTSFHELRAANSRLEPKRFEAIGSRSPPSIRFIHLPPPPRISHPPQAPSATPASSPSPATPAPYSPGAGIGDRHDRQEPSPQVFCFSNSDPSGSTHGRQRCPRPKSSTNRSLQPSSAHSYPA